MTVYVFMCPFITTRCLAVRRQRLFHHTERNIVVFVMQIWLVFFAVGTEFFIFV